ncbi:MAG: VanW family protein [Peptoniphilaceae bacterium]|uniref:VanW family protein n=1 Tax=Parvimonas sp. TaxID=1944660 RepID=UPI0025E64451|nr:VanW family protein [Parvimonas sp.]MCI5997526.1 VanW family protein [Parvimonas sp.]MDD7764635.1 VanW family protein [Peptoniphilaceae bacterium]MDY3050611.1 VanW family protein [Parvimonas sp.]
MKLLKILFALTLIFVLSSCSLFKQKPLKNATGNTKEMTKEEILLYDKMYEGVTINGIDIKDLSREDVLKKIQNNVQLPQKIMLKSADYSKDISLSEIELNLDYEQAVKDAFNIGRVGSDDDRIALLQILVKTPKNISIKSKFNSEKLSKVIDEISKDLDVVQIDDKIEFSSGKAVVVEGTDGKAVDKYLLEGLFYNFNENLSAEIPIKVIEHKKIDKSLVSAIKGVIGESTTYFDAYDTNRNTNIAIAAKTVSDIVIMPGEIFSFSDILADVTTEKGYKPAGTFLEDKVVNSIGGGICQVSSTLYQAAVKSDLKIIERNQHSQRVAYCTIGLDAMYYSGSSDLKLQNTFNFPIAITSIVSNNNITFRILGDTDKKNYNIDIFTDGVITIPMPIEKIKDDNLEEGKVEIVQKGYPGYRGSSYFKRDGEDAKLLNSDSYNPKKQIIKVGTKKKEDKPEKDKDKK